MECPVCMEIFKIPLLLPGCGHTICASCAALLVTPDNYLRCPECRLVYQLRRGVASLPKNIALQRTIDEQLNKGLSEHARAGALTCDEHVGDALALYCKTCDKSICLKCYFANTLRKGQTLHTGHNVETSEDVYTKECRLLEENYQTCLEHKAQEAEYISNLERVQNDLPALLEVKVKEIDRHREELISHVRKTAAKLKFTLRGTVAKDSELLKVTLQGAQERTRMLHELSENAEKIKERTGTQNLPINEVKETRRKLEVLPVLNDLERPAVESFMAASHFDTSLQPCIQDPKRALSYQTEPPREPEILEHDCIISSYAALIAIRYNQTIRCSKLQVSYKEALYKGLSVKQWSLCDVTSLSNGRASLTLKELVPSTMYRVFVHAVNEFGQSNPSKEIWFRTLNGEVEIRKT